MTIDEIFNDSKKDLQLDLVELDNESVRTPDIYNKYLKEWTLTKLKFKKLEKEKAILFAELRDYYLGDAEPEVYEQRGDILQKVLKKDVESYIQGNPDWIKLQSKLDIYETKLELLSKILGQISQRSFNIKNAIDWNKFQNGGTL